MDMDNITLELKELQNEIRNLKIEQILVSGLMGIEGIETIKRSLNLLSNPNIYRVLLLALSFLAVSIYDLHFDMDKQQLQELKEEIELIKEETQKNLVMKKS